MHEPDLVVPNNLLLGDRIGARWDGTTGPEGSRASVTLLEAFVLQQSVTAHTNQTGWSVFKTWP